jgi:hypothetical protein
LATMASTQGNGSECASKIGGLLWWKVQTITQGFGVPCFANRLGNLEGEECPGFLE